MSRCPLFIMATIIKGASLDDIVSVMPSCYCLDEGCQLWDEDRHSCGLKKWTR